MCGPRSCRRLPQKITLVSRNVMCPTITLIGCRKNLSQILLFNDSLDAGMRLMESGLWAFRRRTFSRWQRTVTSACKRWRDWKQLQTCVNGRFTSPAIRFDHRSILFLAAKAPRMVFSEWTTDVLTILVEPPSPILIQTTQFGPFPQRNRLEMVKTSPMSFSDLPTYARFPFAHTAREPRTDYRLVNLNTVTSWNGCSGVISTEVKFGWLGASGSCLVSKQRALRLP
jgi:hypothetical protein